MPPQPDLTCPDLQQSPVAMRPLSESPRAYSPPAAVSAPGCEACNTASMLIGTGSAVPESRGVPSSLGPAAKLGLVEVYRQQASRCPVCRLLLAEITAQCGFFGVEPPDDQDAVEILYVTFRGLWSITLEPPTPLGFPKSSKAHMSFARYIDPDSQGADASFANLHEKEALSAPFDVTTIDFDRVLGWTSYCDASHRGTCHAIQDPWMRVEYVEKITLIDVDAQCVTEQSGSTAYLALSYVWGHGLEDEPLVTNNANLGNLFQSNSLGRSAPLGRRLPRTIRDAMTITSRLGYRYLWVDRLCIVQDDQIHKQHQLEGMAAIYANASITIIASHGDDSHGVPGLDRESSTPRRAFDTISLPNSVDLLFNSTQGFGEPHKELSAHDYHRRGWTMQEEMLSSRTLAFSDREVVWKCRKMRCRESFDDRRQIKDNRTASTEVKLYKRGPDIDTYGYLASDYTGRFLTYDFDAILAFSAIVTAFSRSMPGGILYGLPEVFFEGTLLWQPHEPMARREPSSTGHITPSWSFLGWKGSPLDVGIWRALYTNRGHAGDQVSFRTPMNLFACVEYSKIDSKTGARSRVQSGYYNDPNLCLLKNGPNGPVASPKLSAFSRDTHLRVRPPAEPLEPVSGSWLPVLEFRTKRCSVRVGDVIPKPKNTGDGAGSCLEKYLVDENGTVVGGIRLNTKCCDAVPLGERLDLIAISRCLLHDYHTTQIYYSVRLLPEMRLFHAKCPEPCFRHSDCLAEESVVGYDFYNVMWVGWDGNVAHRKALGRVLAKFWDEQQPEDVDIRLA